MIFDQGPNTGSDGSGWSNFTEQATLPKIATIKAISIFTCMAPTDGSLRLKVLTHNGGGAGNVLDDEDGLASGWVTSGNGFELGPALMPRA